MILQCPSCDNRYLVDPRALGEAGRTVRCAKCRHQWFAAPPDEAPEADVIPAMPVEEARPQPRPLPTGSSVPAIATPQATVPQGVQYAAVAALALFLFSAFVYFRPLVVEAVPGLKGSYAALGMYDTDGIVFAGLEYAQTKSVSKDSHRIAGYLVNTSALPRPVPMVSISLFSESDDRIRRTRIVDAGVMAPGEERRFSRELMTSPESARRVELETGSPFSLKLR